jgi:RNA polymerase sigma-70 factor (ECF subfamily)
MNATVDFNRELVNAQDEMFRFALHLTTNREEAGDLVQETSLKALEYASNYTPETNFKGWMYTIMRNLFINSYRRATREQTYSDLTDDDFYLNKGGNEGTTTDGALDLKEMHHIVNALPDDFRQPFAMYVAGFKYREISEHLNMPMGTVKSHIFATRRTLQEQLKDFR